LEERWKGGFFHTHRRTICCVTFFTFRFLKFYLSAMPSLHPATLSGHRLVWLFSDLPPCYSFSYAPMYLPKQKRQDQCVMRQKPSLLHGGCFRESSPILVPQSFEITSSNKQWELSPPPVVSEPVGALLMTMASIIKLFQSHPNTVTEELPLPEMALPWAGLSDYLNVPLGLLTTWSGSGLLTTLLW
jgi:hypothetical protein